MIDLNKRLGIISEIVKEVPGLGKTAMMKYIFLLQKVYKVPLGYDFEIYTYGPYSSEVMEDIDFAKHQDIIAMEMVNYSTGHSGYNLTPSTNSEKVIKEANEFVSTYKHSIEKVVALFGNKTAKELELATTIVYLYGTYAANNWDCTLEEISSNVRDIKPHFDIATIQIEYRHLDDLGILKQAI
ncbi:MAG: hypothetical protein PHF24_07700 [Syntrophomonas sp.]|nr:hypothetical protein [Syntrophomonas sp.]